MTQWRTITDYPNYEVSDAGEVRRKGSKRPLKPFVDALQEYARVTLYRDGWKRRKVMVHVLVMEAFVGRKEEGMEIDHINTDRSDCRLSNLRYVTPKENRSNPLTVLNNRRRFGPQRVTEQYLF